MLQLYIDIKKIEIFKQVYFYQRAFPREDLRAVILMKENYIRQVKGRDRRIGHNFEAAVDWFIDKFTTGARFWEQKHRDGKMDPRRITVRLVKSVGRRKRNAEVDRVWSITPSPLAQEITYVLQSKWSLVTKRDLDDHLEVLRWSQEFGADTPDGREIKQTIRPIFAGGAFNPRNMVRIGNQTISLPQYAARMNIQLIKASDLNKRLHDRGIETYVTLKKVCRLSKDEKEVRETLSKIWNQRHKSREMLDILATQNSELYSFEKHLEDTRGGGEPVMKITT